MISRRTFLAGASAFVATVAVGGACGSSTDAEELVRVDPTPPKAPELDDDLPKYVEEARAYLVIVPASIRARARAILPADVRPGLAHGGLLALSEVCPKDQLRLERCATSSWFECPACGSFFDPLGDVMAGPSPRGMTLHPVSLGQDDDVLIASKQRVPGLPKGTRLVDHAATGIHCI